MVTPTIIANVDKKETQRRWRKNTGIKHEATNPYAGVFTFL